VSTTEGFTTDAFAGVRATLENNLASGADLGASVTVHHKGEVVVDIWGGFVDEAKTTPWATDTIVNVWSTTKTMTFLVALLLLDRGELDFDRPVADYWPEFADAGKQDVKIRHVLAHTAGLSGWSEHLEPHDLADWEKCTAALARQSPWWEPGTKSGYHAVTQGFLIGEVVRRVTGQSIGSFFHRELAEPLGADFFIGLPESEESRVSLVVPPPPADFSGADPNSIMVRTLTSPLLDATMPHNRWWRAAEIPAANGHGNARSVALVQSIVANGGETAGRRFVRRETLDRIFVTEAQGDDLVLGVPLHFGAGYGLSSATIPLGPRACAWGGFGGSVIIMDQDSQLTISYMMNKMQGGLIGDTRGSEIAFAAAMATATA
jgi:CubicO group peptidase (beta-lactamase class C family)